MTDDVLPDAGAVLVGSESRVRPAVAVDAAAVIGVFLRARAAMRYLPRLHTGEETAEHFTERVLPGSEVWVAESGGRVVGFAAVHGDDLDHLYVDPLAQGQGLGDRLLAAATAGREHLELWVFQRNTGARRFYERHGWQLRFTTDGQDNEECEPDARYRWTA